jgi:antitoxin component YwqK of YwqJK toxin-antitoxin module
MKKVLLVLFILFFIASCCKKEKNQRIEITQRYEGGKKKNLCKYSGKGEFEQLMEIVTYNKDGQVIEIKNLAEQTKEMIWRQKNGMKKVEIQYKKGKKHGKSLEWYSNGMIKKEKVYCQDKLVSQANYKRDITEETIYKTGKLFIAREYKEGIIVTEKTYQGGKLIKAVWFYPDGKISDERGYRDGKKHGKWVYWDRNSEIRNETVYRNGKPVQENQRSKNTYLPE